jgi:hypothetical protein
MKATALKSFLIPFIAFGLFTIKPTSTYARHPFYVSVTEMKHVAKTKLLEISCKMFAEDMQDVLRQNYKTGVDFDNNKLEAQNNKLINDYIVKHLALSIDGKAALLKYVGFEKENESIFCYFEVDNIPPPTKVVITNSILQDFKPEQINIIHVIVNGNRKSTKLDFPEKQASFTF